MSTMTIEAQRQHIEHERSIIKSIRESGKVAAYDMDYIKDIEAKIKQREAWIAEQEAAHD